MLVIPDLETLVMLMAELPDPELSVAWDDDPNGGMLLLRFGDATNR
jgi:hypothetical protein